MFFTEISKNSKLHRANVYDSIEKLKKKGLVNYIKKNNKTHYQASDPNSFLNLLKEKELAFKGILPQLKLNYKLSSQKSSVEIYEGVAAIRNLMKHYLEKKEDIYDYGVPKIAVQLIGKFSQDYIHKQRAKQKQWMYHIYNSDAKERIKYLNTIPYTKAKYLPQEYDSPVTTRICGNEVSITHYSENPITIIIRNKQMAKSYKNYFKILWKKAKEK